MTPSEMAVALEARAFGCEYRMSAEGNTDQTSGDAIDARIMRAAAQKLRQMDEALGEAEDKILELQQPVWPEWATSLLKILEGWRGEPLDPFYEGINLPEELHEWFEGWKSELKLDAARSARTET